MQTDDVEIIFRYFPDLTSIQKEQFRKLGPLYSEWNERVNVISRKDIEHLYIHHILHSLAIAKFFPFPPGSTILDIGTGGGFPGIPLAILYPHCMFHLVDSIGKKIKVVNEIISATALQNTKAQQARVEQLPRKYDIIVSRAVTTIEELLGWISAKLNSNGGLFCLKGGDLQNELERMKRDFTVVDLKSFFSESFFETKKIVYLPVLHG